MKSLLVFLFVVAVLFIGCTENRRAKVFGGSITSTLPAKQKLVTATWKDDDLWYLYRPARAGESIERYTFKENSSFGVWEGDVVFQEVQ